MIHRMVTSALFAGFAAGLLAALLHFAFIQKSILLSEQYESGALTHFGAAPQPAETVQSATDPAPETDGHGHSHEDGDHGAASDLSRNGLTVLFSGLVYVAYGLILVAGFALADHFGKRITAREGLLWGIAGFAAFQLLPAMGLVPSLPGTIAAEFHLRQYWWFGTVGASITGLALIGYGRGAWPVILGVVLLALPHIIGAPQAEQYWGAAPPELGATFAARVLGVALTVWAVLGWLAGHFWSVRQADAT